MKKITKISFGGLLIIAIWIVIAQSCMQFKISDTEVVKQFDMAGVPLTAITTKIGNRHMHYVKTGNDTLPTIVFVHGSPGSWNAFADYMKDKDSANYVYVIGDNKLSSDLTPITESINGTYTKLKLDRKYNDPKDPNRFYYRSDHYNFAEKGVPIIFYFNGVHPDYHRPTDTPDKINYSLMEKRAKLVFYTAVEMANREEMLKRDMSLDQKAF